MLTESRVKKLKSVVKNRQSGFVVVLEDVHDPHNAAAVIRTCDTFGIKDIYMIFKNQKEYDPKKIGKESSSSANKWVNFKTFYSTKKCIDTLKQNGYKVFVTAIDKNAQDITKTDFNYNKIALIFGNEHRGVSKEAIKNADSLVIIPQLGMVQSLNISVSAAICIFEASRQRKNKYKLTKTQQKELLNIYKNKASKAMVKLARINESKR